MHFFDKKYVNSELDDSEYALRQEAYRKHLDSINDRLPKGLLDKLSKVKFHDALLESAVVDSLRHEVVLELFCMGWESRWRAKLTYTDAILTPEKAARRIVLDKKSELMYQEIDLEEPRVVQRFIFYPKATEFEISFRDMTCDISEALPDGAKARKAVIRIA